MAWRLHEHVARGEIDNRVRGRVRGKLWLRGIAEPLRLELEGDCEPDLAGCHLQFENADAVALKTAPPASPQRGVVGAMTAARKVRVLDVPVETAIALQRRGEEPPGHLANALHLEWFSELSGRVVIESSTYALQVSAPAWRFTAEEIKERAAGPSALELEAETERWDEFRCEQLLREGDSRTEKFRELFERYREHPDRDRIIAREMGWDWLEEALEAQEQAGDPALEKEDALAADEPAQEGIDWMFEEAVHPLASRVEKVRDELLLELRAGGHLPELNHDALRDFFEKFTILGAKLAGALSVIEPEGDHENAGLAIAFLKRALNHLNEAIAAADPDALSTALPAARIAHYRAELFAVREEMLGLIAHLRA